MISYTLQKKLDNIKDLSCSNQSGSGAFGYYIQISSKKGIKILYRSYPSREELIKNRLADAVKEANNARMVKRVYSNVPRCYGVKILKTEEGWRIGIVYQHLGNKTLESLSFHEDKYTSNTIKYDMCRKIGKDLKRRGIFHDDIHTNNIMVYKGKYWVIDFNSVSRLSIAR